MAGPSTELPGPETPQKSDRRPPSERARTVAMVLLAVLITLFAVLNLREVRVNWIVGSGHAPLIIVIVVSLLVGIVLTYFTERRGRKRR